MFSLLNSCKTSFVCFPQPHRSYKDLPHPVVEHWLGWAGSKQVSALFNDALNTCYLRVYGVRHMVKDHSNSERGNPLPPHGLLFPISSMVFYMHHPPDRITHTTAYVTPVVEHWLQRERLGTYMNRLLIHHSDKNPSLACIYLPPLQVVFLQQFRAFSSGGNRHILL